MMKKIMAVWLSVICMTALAGCSDNSLSNNSPTSAPHANVADSSALAEEDMPEKITRQDAQAPSSVSESHTAEEAQNNSPASAAEIPSAKKASQEESDTIPTVNIRIGNKNFTAILQDNASTRALLEKLPLTLGMDELNGNEKYYFFSEQFPYDSQKVGSIKTGELMLYGSDCLVLFYEDFSTSYSYTRLGYIEDTAGLAEELGSGSVQVTFSTGD